MTQTNAKQNTATQNAIQIGVCGLGTVASSAVNILQTNAALLAQRSDAQIDLAHVGARRDNPACELGDVKLSRDIFDVASDPNVDVLVELIGGTTVAKELVETALKNGKHVVTANKALIAEHGPALLQLAEEKNVQLRFEAAVAGGIPVIRALSEGLGANEFSDIAGIINGTGNYILTEMSEHGRSYDDALADAQRLGYAEADPTFDVEGIDAAQKLVILAALGFGSEMEMRHCYTEGISKLTVDDIHFAAELGYKVKHLGLASKRGEDVTLRVHPALVADAQLISQVSDVMNAVYVKGSYTGSTLYYGPGAGGDATASAVVSDIMSLARGHIVNYQVPSSTPLNYLDIAETESAFYLRVNVSNQAGALAKITQCLGQHNISVEALHQSAGSGAKGANQQSVPVVLTTNVVKELNFHDAVKEIERLDIVSESAVSIRIANLD